MPQVRARAGRSPAASGSVALGGFLVLGLLAALVVGESALAAGAESDAEHYRSHVSALEPRTEGLSISVAESGESITLENRTGAEVIVLGYANEPYLRFTAAGVDENAASLSAHVNAGRRAPDAVVPGRPSAVDWQRRSTSPRHTWRDYRITWSAQQRPPIVVQDEHAQHRVLDWALPLSVAGQPVQVRGAVDWTGTPRFGGFRGVLLGQVAAGIVALGVAMVLVLRRRPTRPSPTPSRRRH